MSDNASAAVAPGARLGPEAMSEYPLARAGGRRLRIEGIFRSDFVGVISSPSERHEEVLEACRNHIPRASVGSDASGAYASVDETGRRGLRGSRYGCGRVSIQYVASARWRATAAMAF
jgi:hypothetical protein